MIRTKTSGVSITYATRRKFRYLIYWLLAASLLLIGHMKLHAQSGASIYHLQNETYQGSFFNPAFHPNEKFILGIPVLSGMTVGANAPFTFNEVTVENERGNLEVSEQMLADQLEDKTFVSWESDFTLLYLGWKPRKKIGVSFSARQRAFGTAYIDRDIGRLAILGNSEFENRTIILERTLVDVRYLREYGLAFAGTATDYNIDIGMRVKMIHGIANIVSDPDADATIFVGDGFEQSARISSIILRTSGLESMDVPRNHYSPNKNFGLGIDMGVNWRVQPQWSLAIAVNDFGFISWKADNKIYQANDVDVEVDGAEDVIGNGSINSILVDSIQHVLEADTTTDRYRTALNTNVYASSTYHITSKDMATLSLATYFVQNQSRVMFSLGYTRKVGNFLAVSANATRVPQDGFDLGMGLALDFAGMKVYAASDKLTKIWDYENAQAFDARFGMVFIFGRGKNRAKKVQGPEDAEYNDGAIYQKIRRQRPPQPYRYPKRTKLG